MSRINGTSLGISGSTGHQLRGAAKQLHAAKAEHDRYMRGIRVLDRYVRRLEASPSRPHPSPDAA